MTINPTHDGRMRDTCQTGNAAKPDTFEVKTNTVYPCFNRCAAQRGYGIITTAIFAFIALFTFDLAVFDADCTPTVGTGHPKAYKTTILMHQCQIFNTDQGRQFTFFKWVDTLLKVGIKVSMDSKGRFMDNCPILDDHIAPSRSALFLARSVLRRIVLKNSVRKLVFRRS